MDQFANFFLRTRLPVAVFVVLMTAAAVWGELYGSILPDWSPNEAENPDWEFHEQVEEQFGGAGGECLLVVESESLFEPETMAQVRSVIGRIEALDIVAAVIGLDQVPVLGPLGTIGKLIPNNGASPEAFQQARQRAIAHPLVDGQLLSDDAETLLMPVLLDFSKASEEQRGRPGVKSMVADIRDEAVLAAAGTDLRVRLTGRWPLWMEQDEAFDRDNKKFTLIGYTLVFVLAVILFRGLSAVLIVAGAPILGVFWSVGWLHLLGFEINGMTEIILPILLVMVGFTDGVHLMVDIRRSRAGGASPVTASANAIRHLGTACALTSLTTAIGFSSLLVADAEMIRSFGRCCAVGSVLTFLSVITVVPLLSSTWMGRRIHAGHEHDIVGRNLKHFHGLIDFILRHSRAVAAGGVAATIGLALVASQLRPDSKLESDFPSHSPAYQALAHCGEAFGGVQFIGVVIDWPERLEQNWPEVLDSIAEVEQLLIEEPLVRHPLSIRDVLSVLPGPTEELADRMPLLGFAPKQITTRLFRIDERRARVLARVQDLGIAKYRPVFADLKARFAELESRRPGFEIRLTGEPVVNADYLSRIISDLASSLALATGIILVVMGLAYRSLRLGLISVVPNLFPLAATAGLLAVSGRALEITSVCAFTICLGIAVDDTIHFLSRYKREIQLDGDVEAAIRRSFIGVGTALVMTTIVLVSGFATVLTSELPAFRLFGAMCCSTIGGALIGDLVILPAILHCFARAPEVAPADAVEAPPSETIEATPAAEVTSL